MTFNPLKEKGIPIEKQLRTWKEIAGKPYNKTEIDCYSRTRQILMNVSNITLQEYQIIRK